MKYVVSIVICLISYHVFAETKEDKVWKLMEAQGLLPTFEKRLLFHNNQSIRHGERILARIKSKLSLSSTYINQLDETFDEFKKGLVTPWDREEIISVWTAYYGSQFSNEELDELIKFHTSPLGKKQLEVSGQALTNFLNHFTEKNRPVIDKAFKTYIANLKAITEECNCLKP